VTFLSVIYTSPPQLGRYGRSGRVDGISAHGGAVRGAPAPPPASGTACSESGPAAASRRCRKLGPTLRGSGGCLRSVRNRLAPLRTSVGVVQVGAAQIGSEKVGADHAGADQVGVLELGVGQDGAARVDAVSMSSVLLRMQQIVGHVVDLAVPLPQSLRVMLSVVVNVLLHELCKYPVAD
jgi:hypothetical protein